MSNPPPEQRRGGEGAPRPSPRKRGYTYRWELARLRYLQRNPLCVLCQQMGRTTAANVVDHIRKHNGTPKDPLFWDRANWQALCKHCHDMHKQHYDRTGHMRVAYGSDGYPLPSLGKNIQGQDTHERKNQK